MPPCDSLITSEVIFGKAEGKLIHAALTEMKLKPVQRGDTIYFTGGYFETKTGKLTMQGSSDAESVAKELKRAYSGQIVVSQAKRFGFQVVSKGDYKYQLVKRSI